MCVDDPTAIPSTALRCGVDLAFECADPSLDTFYVTAFDLGRASCGSAEIDAATPIPLAPGAHVVDAFEVSPTGPIYVCTATVTVEDTTPPIVRAKRLELWPPNHKWQDILPEDCADFSDACGDVDFRFTYVSVDEPVNDRGDGNTEPDVEIDCGTLRARPERQGGGDGRIYRVGFEVRDQAGNITAGTCDLEVPPNQSRPATWSGERYRVEPSSRDCGPSEVPPPPSCEDEIPYDSGLNTGPLPPGCAKIEDGHIGREGAEIRIGMERATLTGWRGKGGGPGEYIGFDLTLTSTPAWLSVKAGRDVFGDRLEGTLEHTWVHPAGTSGPRAKAISNIVLCILEPCEEAPPAGPVDGGLPASPDAGAADLGVDDAGDHDAGPDLGARFDAGSADQGSGLDAGVEGAPDARLRPDVGRL